MEIFKTDYLKKEFRKFQKEDLVAVLSCGYHQKTCCKWKHNKFFAGCKYCREGFCKNCHKFKTNLEALLLGTDTIGRDYLQNFITDFLHIDISTIQTFFSNTVEKIPVVKEVQVKSYVKSEKNRSQVVTQKLDNIEKIKYKMKGKQRTFYKKF